MPAFVSCLESDSTCVDSADFQVDELVMWCLFKKLRGYLLFLQMMQLPLPEEDLALWRALQRRRATAAAVAGAGHA